jgi:hypothetical protein
MRRQVTSLQTSGRKWQTAETPAAPVRRNVMVVGSWRVSLRWLVLPMVVVALGGCGTDGDGPRADVSYVVDAESATIPAPSSTHLTLHFGGSPDPGSEPCGVDYTARAVESADAVSVTVTAHPHVDRGGDGCAGVGAPRTALVELSRPLARRTVNDARHNRPVPVTTAD